MKVAQKGAEARNIPFLSDKYMEMLAHVTAEAKRLGLGVDMATGTGWPFGGPNVTQADAELQVDIVNGKIETKPTGFSVKRAAPGGGGLVVNPYSVTAISNYLKIFSNALSKLPKGALRSQFHDSFEYKATWANEIPEKFRTLHGYDLFEHAKELGGLGDPDTVSRVKADYRKTVEELHLEYIQTWVKWAHSLGELTREQAHGSPGNLLDLYAAADIPETELFGAQKYPIPGFRRDAGDVAPDAHPPMVHRLASSAAHVAGHPLSSSETFTWLREHFREAPSQMKPEIDQLFLTGINHLVYHGTAYSPSDAPWPGWLFYAATEANSRNPLWSEFANVNGYIERCESMLQSGAPDNDILLYWPLDDLWHSTKGMTRRLSVHSHDWLVPTTAGQAATEMVEKGYAFDFISDRQVLATDYVNNSIKTSGGNYRTLLIPHTEHMSPATLRHMIALANQGATVLFIDALPTDVPGLGTLEKRRADLKAQIAQLKFTAPDANGVQTARVGKGSISLSVSVQSLLAIAKTTREPVADLGLGFIRRRLPEGYVYFIANLSDKPVESWVKLGKPATSAVLLDPMTKLGGVAAFDKTGDNARVFLQLRPGESIFIKTLDSRQSRGEAWNYYKEKNAPVIIEGDWKLTFLQGGLEIPAPRKLSKLGSWTDATDAAAQNFGGTARYEIEFSLPEGAKPDAWRLILGDVRETAHVSVNGTDIGHVWGLPFDTLIAAPLKIGRNVLTIDVTSTASNRIRDLDKRGVQWKNGKNFVNIDYKPFDASGWLLKPSGLLGPIQLVPLYSLHPEALK